MLPKELKPYSVDLKNLVRIGPNFDGGYIIDKRIINQTKTILTLGLSDDWRFEKEYLKLNSSCKIFAYDHTVDNNFWKKRLIKDLINFIKLKKLRPKKIIDIFKYIDYKFFFKGNNLHIKKKIVNKSENLNEISFIETIEDLHDVLVKIDIEGDEDSILHNIRKVEKQIMCLLIEFHNISENINNIVNFIKNLKELKLIHIHGNNYAGTNNLGDPNCIELTFLNSRNFEINMKKSKYRYPIKDIDNSNMKRREDISLNFKNE